MKKYYVILTGSKNNAGDFLIKYRAKEIFALNRPDRDIIDIDGWKEFDDKTLSLVNNSEALILMGGPALQKNMYPGVYPLVDDLSKITTKIILMGVGWKSLNGSWNDSQNYEFSEKTKKLLDRVNHDSINSVRDYHTLNALLSNGYKNVLMTGCPATYDSNGMLGELGKYNDEINRIGFSLGVSFLESKEMHAQMKNSILSSFDYFKKLNKDCEFIVVFHHSTRANFLDTHNATKKHLIGHQNFTKWLDSHNIKWIDISGSAENLIDFYSSCDFHLGYRVHAHIFMSSINKPSVLIAEDGRGRALPQVFGGVVINSFISVKNNIFRKILRKLNLSSGFEVSGKESVELVNYINYEVMNGYPMMRKVRNNINDNYLVMKDFLKSLP